MKKVLQKTNNSHFFKLINLMFFFFKKFFFAVDISRHYAFYYNPNYKLLENGWALFQTEEEFAKLIHSADSDWRISYVNIDGSVSEIHILLQKLCMKQIRKRILNMDFFIICFSKCI